MRSIRVSLGALVVLTLLSSALTTTSSAAPLAAPIDCPTVKSVDDVAALPGGTALEGFSVTEGTEPSPFSASLIGVMRDGIAPGLDLIVVEATSDDIDEKGIWQGMSGSPVYHEGELIGAIAYSLTWGASKVVGLTAAEDMVEISNYPAATTTYSVSRLSLTRTMAQRISTATALSTSDFSSSMEQLKVPRAVSGAGRRGFERLERTVAREGLAFRPYAAPSSTASIVPAGTVHAGESLAVAFTQGDITMGAVGTTTFVCDGKAVGFGHPMLWDGAASRRATAAETLTIVGDPLGSAYKLATLSDGVGTLVQDRLAGIVVDLSEDLAGTTVDSTVEVPHLSKTRVGHTDVFGQEELPYAALLQLFVNIDVTYDEIGPGSSEVGWVVQGTRESGEPWSLTRTNKFVSDWDISSASVDEVYSQLYSLIYNRFEDVEITSVDLSATIDDDIRRYRIVKVLTSKDGVTFQDVRSIRTRPGRLLWFKTILRPSDGSADRVRVTRMRVPQTRRFDGYVSVSGGRGDDFFYYEEECFFDEDCGFGPSAKSFDELLENLATGTTNDQFTTTMSVGRASKSVTKTALEVVQGSDFVRLRIVQG